MNYLHWLDYVVMAALMIVSLGIGIFFAVYRGGQRTKVEYLLGNRQMSMIPVCLSMFITYQSAIALLGVPADVFNTGTMYLFLGCGVALSYIVSLFTAVPLLYPLKITSVNEYLELRFDSKCVRLFATILGMLQTVLYMAMALFSPAIALQTATGLPLWVSIAILGGICTLYTAVGGIKSVVWTDVFQTGVYVIGVGTVIVMVSTSFSSLFIIIIIINHPSSLSQRHCVCVRINPDVRERHSLWATLIGGCFTMFSGFTQSIAQRISSLKTLKKAKLAFLLSAPINLLNECILTLMGVLLYAYVVTIGCDPYQAGIIDSRNQKNQPPDYEISQLSCANEVYLPSVPVLLYGGLTIGLAYLARSIRGPVTQITITVDGACSGSINGIFFMAGMVPWTNKYGAIGGGLIGIAINLWISVGSLLYGAPTLALPPGPTHNCPQNNSYSYSFNNFTTVDISMTDVEMSTDTNPSSNITNLFHSRRGDTFFIYDISYLWLSPIGFFVTLITGIIISFITGSTNKATLDPKLVFPFTRKLFRMNEPPQEAENSSDVIVMKKQKKSSIVYPNIPSALRPVHGEELPFPEPPAEYSLDSAEDESEPTCSSPGSLDPAGRTLSSDGFEDEYFYLDVPADTADSGDYCCQLDCRAPDFCCLDDQSPLRSCATIPVQTDRKVEVTTDDKTSSGNVTQAMAYLVHRQARCDQLDTYITKVETLQVDMLKGIENMRNTTTDARVQLETETNHKLWNFQLQMDSNASKVMESCNVSQQQLLTTVSDKLLELETKLNKGLVHLHNASFTADRRLEANINRSVEHLQKVQLQLDTNISKAVESYNELQQRLMETSEELQLNQTTFSYQVENIVTRLDKDGGIESKLTRAADQVKDLQQRIEEISEAADKQQSQLNKQITELAAEGKTGLSGLQQITSDLRTTLTSNVQTLTNLISQTELRVSELEKKLSVIDNTLNRLETNTNKSLEVIRSKMSAISKVTQEDQCRLKAGYVWYLGTCFKFLTIRVNYTTAKAKCEADGAHLYDVMSPDLDEERVQFAIKQANVSLPKIIWVGGNDLEVEGDYRWSDGTPLSSSSKLWDKGQPNDI
ncbi:hypothetical protein C0Q70_09053 [Pomacea canaliculata]|uniref:C-type lectin domain-containing protein n=1 Tax=Pomacea canaliculata TaxID=400727 RepID=A0A2T7P8S0_POMCA|nr:hypothetical protein C0Q70_09053 [Pomacea canaliculata]